MASRGPPGGRPPGPTQLSRLIHVRIARFAHGDEFGYGIVEDVQPDGAAGASPDTHGLAPAEFMGHPFGIGAESVRLTGSRFPPADVSLLAPVLPTKVVAIVKNS